MNCLSMAPDGSRVAYIATDKGRHVVITDGQPTDPYEDVGEPMFSADGTHVVFNALREGKSVVCLDGTEGPEYDEIIAGPVYLPATGVEYLARRGELRLRVVQGAE